MASEVYSKSADFPNQAVAVSKLFDEIEADATITATVQGVTVRRDVVTITFDVALSGPEKTALDAIVAAHDGVPPPEALMVGDHSIAERTQEISSDNEAYTEVLSLSVNGLREGEYFLRWAVVYGMDSSSVNIKLRIQVDNTDTPLEYTEEASFSSVDERVPRSGFFPVSLTDGDHVFDMDCGKDGAGPETWYVYKAWLELVRVE